MTSTTVQEGLRSYRIGAKVRELRLRKKLGLVELGRHTGLSPALLSKIEGSKIFPPLGTLLRIALVFDVGLDYFFTERVEMKTVAIVRKNERLRFPAEAGQKAPPYVFESLDFPCDRARLELLSRRVHRDRAGESRRARARRGRDDLRD
jgi:transcriptional regulator with XRE-family HTH domain